MVDKAKQRKAFCYATLDHGGRTDGAVCKCTGEGVDL